MVFFLEPAPEIVQGIPNGLIIQIGQALTPKDHDVHAGHVTLEPESLPDLTFYPVSLDGQLEVLLGKNQTDPGMTEIVRRSQDQEIPVRNLQLYVIEDFAVIRWPQETGGFRETQSLHQANRSYADRRARPLARRRDRTLRPLAVAIRARKPWTRLRFRTLG